MYLSEPGSLEIDSKVDRFGIKLHTSLSDKQQNTLDFFPNAPFCWVEVASYMSQNSTLVTFEKESKSLEFLSVSAQIIFTFDLIKCLGIDNLVFRLNENLDMSHSNSDICDKKNIEQHFPEKDVLKIASFCSSGTIHSIYEGIFASADYLITTISSQASHAQRMANVANSLRSIDSDAICENESDIESFSASLTNATDSLIQSIYNFSETDTHSVHPSIPFMENSLFHKVSKVGVVLKSFF